MATKHQLQYYMFSTRETLNKNLVHAVIQLEAATFRLQHIQVSCLIYVHDYVYNLCLICRSYTLVGLVWNFQLVSTEAFIIPNTIYC